MLSDALKVIEDDTGVTYDSSGIRMFLKQVLTAYDKGRGLNLEAAREVIEELAACNGRETMDRQMLLYWLCKYHTALCSEPEGKCTVTGCDDKWVGDNKPCGDPDCPVHGVADSATTVAEKGTGGGCPGTEDGQHRGEWVDGSHYQCVHCGLMLSGSSPGPDRSECPDKCPGKSTPAGHTVSETGNNCELDGAHTTHSPGGSEGLPQAGDNEACPFCGIYPVSNGPELQHPTVKGCPLSDCLFNPAAWNRRTGEDKGA